MAFRKYARSEGVLEVKTASERITPSFPGEAFSKFAALEDTKTNDGYLYVRTRAISSRVNKNNDGWPSEELAKGYKTFIGRPVFVDHNNSDPQRTRGVIVDSKLHVEDDEKTSALDPYYSTAPDNHKPPTWVEILIEVDAKTYPKLAKAIKNGDVDATSMGANIDKSICSVCANEATSPSEYCDHVKKKGATFEITADNGEKIQKKAWEDCYGVNFFEDSFVFDPADETALNIGVDTKPMTLAKVAADKTASWYSCQECNTLLDNGTEHCPKCGGDPMKHEHTENMPEQKGKRGSLDELVKVADGYHVSCRDCGEHMINVRDDNDANYYHCTGCGRSESNLSTLAPFLEHNKTAEYKYVKKRGDKWVIIQKGTGKVLSTHDSQEQAEAAFRAMEMNMHGGKVAAADPKVIALAQQVLQDPQAAVGNFNISGREVQILKALAQAVLVEGTTSPFLAKMADFGMGGQGVDKERVLNYEPQEDMTKAPAKVDTLQDDIECPNCRSDYLQADPDGILRCPTCSYEQPPQGLDNPDLGAAQRENDKDLTNNQGDGQGPAVKATDEDMDLGPNADSAQTRQDNFIQPIKPLQSATKKNVTTEEISEMIWKRRIQTDSATEADAFLPRTAGSVEVPIEYPGGIHFGTHAAFQKHGLNATVHYPGAPQPLPIPGNAMQHFMMQMNAQKAQGLESPGQIVVRVDAPDDQLDNAVKLIHSGGQDSETAQHEGAAPTIKQQPKKEVLVSQPDKPQETVKSDEFAPVTSDRRVIKREETPDGHRSEQIIEETGGLGDEDGELKDEKKEAPKGEESEEKTEEKSSEGESSESEKDEDDKTPDFLKKKEPVAAAVEAPEEDSTARILEALSVAEEYVDAGIMPKGSKLGFVGQLENMPEGEVAAYRAALALFRSASVQPRRVAHTTRALPRLGSVTGTVPTNNGTTSLDDVPLEAIFL